MKKETISIFITALMTLSSLFCSCPAQAQGAGKPKADQEEKGKFLQGLYIGADIWGIANKILSGDAVSSEICVETSLKNKFFPAVEIGYASIDAVNDETDIHFKTAAPYFRIGAGYNVFHEKPYLPGHLLVGLRYGFSSFSYDATAPDMVDPNWGHTVVPVSYQGIKGNVGWIELVVSMKAQVYRNFYMGFSARYRNRISMKKHENTEPLYIPGFGKNGKTNFGLTYNLIYKLPF